jgi:superfamily I DNA/RNA helicase
LQVRLVAGPGTGKSSSIEQRVYWLLQQGCPSAAIFVISFTRASTKDLKDRIGAHCAAQGQANATGVNVSTMHSLALKILRRANLLTHYPVDPLVLDDWELTNIFDAEFGNVGQIGSKIRRERIRQYHEAFWNTGTYNPANYLPTNPPISAAESALFLNFHGPTTQVYSCVLAGEIVRQCVQEMQAGSIDPVALLGIEHLIVDEFQDLNPMDLDFVQGLVHRGAQTFICGDDDQSIYSFRYATPGGIQAFPQTFPATSSHVLDECFRCMPNVLAAAVGLMVNFSTPQRIPKNLRSLYRHSIPSAPGLVHRWTFATGANEARALAESCANLIQAGLSPNDILILPANQRAMSTAVETALQAVNVPFISGGNARITDSEGGRLGLAILRIVVNPDDYVAHRTILGIRQGVGPASTNRIREAVLNGNLAFRDIFYQPLPAGIFTGLSLAALNSARAVCAQVVGWTENDTLALRGGDLAALITQAAGAQEAADWQAHLAATPPDISLKELRDYVSAHSDDDEITVLEAVYERLGLQVPVAQVLPARVRVMTMHGAKGLSARVVFVPGLEEQLIPGPKRALIPGLVLESARLLYVSITRARAALILSRANRRFINGHSAIHTPSRFAAHLGGSFGWRNTGVTPAETQQIIAGCAQI